MTKMSRFSMLGYSGATIRSLFWDRLIIDISGIRTPEGKMPALREHIPDRPVGVIDKVTASTDKLSANGYFLTTHDGPAVSALLDEGYPFQASVGVWFEKIEKIEPGEVANVNGKDFIGPGSVVRQSFVREISFVTLGADAGTSAKNLNNGDMDMIRNTDQSQQGGVEPVNFAQAIQEMLNTGADVKLATKQAMRTYPALYREYLKDLYEGTPLEGRV